MDNLPAAQSSIPAIPPRDVLAELGVEVHETDEFIRALRFVEAQIKGSNVKQAAEVADLDRTQVYTPKWRRMIGAARQLLVGAAVLEVLPQVAKVFEQWPALVDKLIETAMHAERASDSNDAIELLHDWFIDNAQTPGDMSEAYKYLKEGANFNPSLPLAALQVQQGGQVNITINTPAGDDPQAGDVIDVQAVDG